MREDEAQGGVFGPVAVVAGGAIGWRKEGAVATMFGLEQRDLRIGGDLFPRLCGEPDEGIVVGVEDQCGNRDAVEDAGGAGAGVVVVGGAEAAVKRGDAVVKLAQGGDVVGALRIEGSGK